MLRYKDRCGQPKITQHLTVTILASLYKTGYRLCGLPHIGGLIGEKYVVNGDALLTEQPRIASANKNLDSPAITR